MEMSDSSELQRRTCLRVVDFEEKFRKLPEQQVPLKQRLTNRCSDFFTRRKLIKKLYGNFPFIPLIKKYKLKQDLANDVISGLTVGIMQIPQGMAYALLGALPPIVGLYTSFFGPLMYFFLGTSRHASMGTIAIVSLMIASVLDTRLGDGAHTGSNGTTSYMSGLDYNTSTMPTYLYVNNVTGSPLATMTSSFSDKDVQKIRLTAALSFVSVFVMIVLGKINMGFVATYMSEPMVCGFTSAVAIHVTTSQAKHILGIKIGRHNGVFKVIRTWIDIVKNITSINWAPVVFSIICILVIYAVKIHVNLRFKARLKIPIPIEIIVVSIATTISHFAMFKTNYDVNVLEDIPSGLPEPSIPDVTLVGESFKDAVIIGIVAFIQSVSMAKILARKNNYYINPNQEMVAYGAGSVLSAVFSGYIPAASVARSMVQEGSGGHTQVASLFGCLVVLVVILAIGPLFYSLPKCVLSCVILVNLRSMFLQFLELRPLWRKSKYDFIFIDFTDIDVDILLAGCSDGVLDILRSTDFLSEKKDFIFMDVGSAIQSRHTVMESKGTDQIQRPA